ncbi:unnamed protein product [Soboliphyme baturini]|uniref:PAP2_C domain-containing protein n=1 Tax=Soboliphyme baturini TaxID=241478 RepID=A0A183IG75_9BILA|nr:unnamed protein product [Soboliphyme baturini]
MRLLNGCNTYTLVPMRVVEIGQNNCDEVPYGDDGGKRVNTDNVSQSQLSNELLDIDDGISVEEKRFQKEPVKLVIAFLMLVLSAVINLLALAWIHDRVPASSPLPDLFFRIFPHFPRALDFSEYFILFNSLAMFFLCFIHKYRWMVLRRVFFISSLLYLGRSVCLLVTQVPVADTTYVCSPKLNVTTIAVVFSRASHLFFGVGLNISGRYTLCGDYIYSGHTVVLILAYLVVKEYSPTRFWIFHWITWLVSLAGIFCLLISHGHYSVDVVIAYFITTRTFWLYHTLADSVCFKEYPQHNRFSRAWWFMLFQYMESNAGCPIPKIIEWPLSWKRCKKILNLPTRYMY